MSQPILSEEERRGLEARVRASDASREERERCQAVLMAAQGFSHADIALALCCSERTARRHVARWRAAGVRGLVPGKAPGKPRSIPPALDAQLLGWVDVGPRAVGAPCASWTHRSLAQHLGRVHGVRVGTSTMGDWCRRHGVRPHRPSYRSVRADVAAREAAQAALAKKK